MRRREFMLMPAGLAMSTALQAAESHAFRLRTVTAGVPLTMDHWRQQLQQAARFLHDAQARFEDQGYEVQTLRIATQPLSDYLGDWPAEARLQALTEIDEFCGQQGVIISIGPIVSEDRYERRLADWAAELISNTETVSFSVHAASTDGGIHTGAIRTAAEIIVAIARTSPGGEGNFRFAATANCPPGTPFFPAAWHEGEPAFAIGLESPPLLLSAVRSRAGDVPITPQLAAAMDAALMPVQRLAEAVAVTSGRRYLGIDTSPAPGPDASIGEVIEAMAGAPFGSASTLRACADITAALQTLKVATCGYSGLMLPVLEDRILATRAAQGRYGIAELLLYSSVCGTGLDVVPLPGDSTAGFLTAVIGDMAALSARYRKPLSARLFPVPGKSAGDTVSFDNPYLMDSAVLTGG